MRNVTIASTLLLALAPAAHAGIDYDFKYDYRRADGVLQHGALRLDPATRRVSHGTQELKLGPTEFKLLQFLMSHAERVHSRGQLLDKVWGDHVFIEERTVDVHVKRLREALGDAAAMVETVRGAGYRFTAQPATPVLTVVARA